MRKKEVWNGYSNKPCINCGRMRVELSNLRQVCEKCYVDQETGEYAYDRLLRDKGCYE